MPGMYVRAKLEQAVDNSAITVPQQAVQRDLSGAFIFLVDADNKVLVRPVVANKSQGDKWIVSEGLKSGDKVIVAGLQKVNPSPWNQAAAAAHSAGTGASAAAAAAAAASTAK